MYCDGSVMQDGKTGCGVVIRDYLPAFDTWMETEHGYRLSDHISSTQTEIQGIFCGLRELRDGEGVFMLTAEEH